jgi:hypothetical protein
MRDLVITRKFSQTISTFLFYVSSAPDVTVNDELVAQIHLRETGSKRGDASESRRYGKLSGSI